MPPFVDLIRRTVFVAIIISFFLCISQSSFAWTYEPSPFSDHRLIILHPWEFYDQLGKPTAVKDENQYLQQTALISSPLTCSIKIRHAGKYSLWFRVLGEKTPKPLAVVLQSGNKNLLQSVINDGEGSVDRGGAVAFTQYARQAKERMGTTAGGAPDDPDLALDGGIDQNLIDEMNGKPYLRWITASRIEKLQADASYYWWKAGQIDLQPGRYTIRISGGPGKLNAGFLTTYPDLVYPYGGDLDIKPSSYIRFRIDTLPGRMLSLRGKVQKHSEPWFSETGTYTPDGITKQPDGMRPREEAKPFTKTGYTPWYRLQDLKEGPEYGPILCHLLLDIPAGAEGATQFASFPHQDYVVREISWQEFGGDQVSMESDFANGIDKIRTVRDHAREHYQYALNATEEKLYPLTRAPLSLNTGALISGETADYEVKIQRLFGSNVVHFREETVENRRRYGWTSQAGIYAPPCWLPFDEAETKERLADFFKDQFTQDRDAALGYALYQLSDEPPEYLRSAMSSPLWRYYPPEKGGPRVDDRGGSSELYSQKVDYKNCVLEGKFIVYGGGYITIRVGCKEREKSKKYAEWDIGQVMNFVNLRASRDGDIAGLRLYMPNIIEFNKPVPFKVIYGGDTAALYLYGRLINRIDSLPKTTGFGFLGPSGKGIVELRVRPMTPEERRDAIPLDNADPDNLGDLPEEDDAVEVPGADLPDWAKPKPLDRYVKEDWLVAGGVPEAHVAFRKWAAAQGLTPQTFGRQKWDDVTMITVPSLVESEGDRALYYWSRRYSGYLTPKLFSLSAEALRAASPTKTLSSFVALSGHYYFADAYPLDVFQLASHGGALIPGVSDWMFHGTWRWDSHQTVAYSVAPYNAGGRVYGGTPRSYPMMHCVSPTSFRSYTMLANNVRTISYYFYGPSFGVPLDHWSESPERYESVDITNNRVAQVDDVLGSASMRPSRVALLFAMSNEYWAEDSPAARARAGVPAQEAVTTTSAWNPRGSFSDKRATFLGLSHEYFQPELVTEDQVAENALQHYDALYILDPVVSAKAQVRIEEFLKRGGIVWACADALQWDEYLTPADFLQRVAGLQRRYTSDKRDLTMIPEVGETGIRRQVTVPTTVDTVTWPGARIRARYGDGRPAWLEKTIGQGKLIYLAHRCGVSYSKNSISGSIFQHELDALFSDIGREPLVLPLHEAKIDRELTFSSPLIMGNPLTGKMGTVIPIFNMTAVAAKGLAFSLKEPAKPVSVQAFEGMKKVDLPFTYSNGRVTAVLPDFVTSQMVLVRTQTAPADDRLESMHQNTLRLLASTATNDISAGIFFAGFFPEWKLAERILPFLQHENRDIRRSAAEALGRLRYAPSATGLKELISRETDTHALADAIYALAVLGDNRFPEIALKYCDPSRPVLQQRVLQAAQSYLNGRRAGGKLPDDLVTFGLRLAALADDSDDKRIYVCAAPLLGIVAPQRLLSISHSYLPYSPVRDASALGEAIAANEEAFVAYLAEPSANHRILLALAQQRKDPSLAKLLMERMVDLASVDADQFLQAALKQADPGLSKYIFANQQKLPEYLQGKRVCQILEVTFNARLGNLQHEWTEWLKTH